MALHDRLPPTSLPVTILLTGLVAFGPISTDLYLPSLPDMTRAFGTDVSMVQLTLSVFLIGFAFAQLIYGPLSDRFGRRRVVIGGVLTYLAASLFCLFAPSIEMLILGRFLQAVGACCGPVVGRAVVRDVYPREQAARIMSYMASAMALAPAVAPLLGGWLHSLFGWRANFVVLVLFGLLLLVACLTMLAETNRHQDPAALRPSRILETYGLLLSDRHFLGYAAAVAFSFSALFSFISGSSFVLIDVLGLEARHFGFAFMICVIGYIIGTFTAGRLTMRVGLANMITIGAWLGALGGVLLAGFAWMGIETLAAVVGPVALVFLAVGLVLPNASAGAIAPYARMAGSASAMLGFLQMGIGAGAGFLVGLLHDGSTKPMATVIMIATLLSLAAVLGLVRRRTAAAE
ncbi:multidrug effflux MFS transporter [Telmatospirillum sp. J64-1]|uniref:multidrug effflux MFS transporter n=1 Tax=Telmatospirillum sp. J64-1 TaxID=2502183 RepID=UPI00115F0678|nr:multidrug effflux MFS transporter [Telmatospirillum sp. J64-1]